MYCRQAPGLLSDAEIVLHMSDTLGTNISALIVHNVCGASAENTGGGLIFSEHNHIVVGKYFKRIAYMKYSASF